MKVLLVERVKHLEDQARTPNSGQVEASSGGQRMASEDSMFGQQSYDLSNPSIHPPMQQSPAQFDPLYIGALPNTVPVASTSRLPAQEILEAPGSQRPETEDLNEAAYLLEDLALARNQNAQRETSTTYSGIFTFIPVINSPG